MEQPSHTPVLLQEALSYWASDPEGYYVDLTLGLGGHSAALLERLPRAKLLGLDWDDQSLALARSRLARYESRVTFKQGNFATIDRILDSLGIQKVSGFLFDCGTSSHQILGRALGLSFQKDEPLDMRLSGTYSLSVAQIIKNAGESELIDILQTFGELPFSMVRRLTRAIIAARSSESLETTGDLVGVLSRVAGDRKIWAQVFQAFRISVNHELENLEAMLQALPKYLVPGGRIVGISFHSLEDRIVKVAFRSFQKDGYFQILTSKPVQALEEEIRLNPKARSAKLRAVEKI